MQGTSPLATACGNIDDKEGCAMNECEKLDKCLFFSDRLPNMPSVAGLLKQTYCLGDKTKCARYQVSAAGIPVPMDLFPNDAGRVRKLLNQR